MRPPWNVSAWVGLLLVLLMGCHAQSPPAEHGHTEHAISITKWTEDTELFVEFSPLVAGKDTPFAAHLTDLHTFQPVETDIVTATLEGQSGYKLVVHTATPIAPGIYRPVMTPDEPGRYRLVFQRSHPETREVRDTIVAGEVTVAAQEEKAQHEEELEAQGITFLKEQQWKIEFATAPVARKRLVSTLQLYAEVKPAAGGEVHLTAPVGGRILPVKTGVPVPGQKVEPGEPLAMILPLHPSATSRNELESAVRIAQAEMVAAEQELARVRDLYKDRIVPTRRLEQTQKDVAVLKARLASARSQLSLLNVNQTLDSKTLPSTLERFILRSPLAGTAVAVNMTPGALIEPGHTLFTIVDLGRVWIEGRLYELDLPKVHNIGEVRFVTPALAEPLLLAASEVYLATVGSVIDPTTRSVPLILEINNPREQLKIGMHGELLVPTGEEVQDLAIPLDALVQDKGIPVAFVQREGETFERRELELGIESNGYVQVTAGLTAGERIVTKGMYRVHLASLSSELPAHGHGH